MMGKKKKKKKKGAKPNQTKQTLNDQALIYLNNISYGSDVGVLGCISPYLNLTSFLSSCSLKQNS
jgi:hypothetical protein